MKFKVSSSSLLANLQILSRVIGAKNSMVILESILFDLQGNELTMVASDGETSIRTKMQVEGEGDGKVASPARRLLDTLKEFAEQPLVFEINDQNFAFDIKSDTGTYSFIGVNGMEYPQVLPEVEAQHSFSISADELQRMIGNTIFCTVEDQLRPVMGGIYFDITEESLTAVATDAHRLVRFVNTATHTQDPVSFILPRKPASLLRQILQKEEGDVQVSFNNKNARFEMGNSLVICRQLDGRYPNYKAVIPQSNENKIIVDRLSILNASRRVQVFANQSTGLIKLEISENKIHLTAQDIDFSTSAEETIVCNYQGEPIRIGFKAPFLTEILGVLESDEVIIALADSSRAGLILPMENKENEDILVLLMPMLLND